MAKVKNKHDKLRKILARIRLVVFDFDGVFTDNRVLVLEDGTEGVWCSRGDGLGIGLLLKAGIKAMVISMEKNPVVARRCKKLQLPCVQDCDNKLAVLRREAKRLGVPLDSVAFVGNDINDKQCLQSVGLPVCVKDSHPDCLEYAKFITTQPGGCGAVREFCDMLLRSRK